MPDYNYQCESCGGFTANRPMSAFASPAECPHCGALAPRAVSAPMLGGHSAGEAKADIGRFAVKPTQLAHW